LAFDAAVEATCAALVPLAMLRWRIERDYRELKGRAGARSLRGPGLARLPSSRVAVHRRVCVLGRWAADASPWAARFRRPARRPKVSSRRGAPG